MLSVKRSTYFSLLEPRVSEIYSTLSADFPDARVWFSQRHPGSISPHLILRVTGPWPSEKSIARMPLQMEGVHNDTTHDVY